MEKHLPLNIYEYLDVYVMHTTRIEKEINFLVRVENVFSLDTLMERKDGNCLIFRVKSNLSLEM
jgi:hypothetical protein